VSRALEPVLPPALARAVDADPDPDEGFTVLLLSTTSDGWPHAAMISTGEIVTTGASGVRLALWPRSTATANLSSAERASLLAIVDHTSYSVRLSLRRMPDFDTPLAGTLACFDGLVEAASADEAPYAILESGVRFRLKDSEGTLARWRETRSALRAMGGA
jgi:hypothetical protein